MTPGTGIGEGYQPTSTLWRFHDVALAAGRFDGFGSPPSLVVGLQTARGVILHALRPASDLQSLALGNGGGAFQWLNFDCPAPYAFFTSNFRCGRDPATLAGGSDTLADDPIAGGRMASSKLALVAAPFGGANQTRDRLAVAWTKHHPAPTGYSQPHISLRLSRTPGKPPGNQPLATASRTSRCGCRSSAWDPAARL